MFGLDRDGRVGCIVMGDMGDIWREIKESKKRDREHRLSRADEQFDELRDIVRRVPGCDLVRSNDYHWMITLQGRNILSYWPSTNRWYTVREKKTRHGSVDKFRKYLEEKTSGY